VQRDAAWQSALDECYERGYLPTPSWFERRSRLCYKYEGFLEALFDIVNGRSIVHCNFDTCDPVDVE
ncbi:hypothetical protein K458DRAFT_248300, partial [Lentithecium fluviatile CBS 122367]